jgi:hypothetical protein
MHLGSTDMEITRYIGLFDELEKIAEEQRKPIGMPEFKRHLKAVGVIGAGLGLGTGIGAIARRAMIQHKGSLGNLALKHPMIMKALPVVGGGLAAGGAGLGLYLTKQHFDYAEKGDDKSKQHNSK